MDLFEFGEAHLHKDPVMIPHYLSRKTGWNSSIVFYESENNRFLPDTYGNVRLIKLKGFPLILSKVPFIKKFRRLRIFFYLFKNARKIDILNLYHFSHVSALNGLFYKMLNPEGIIYLKLDDDLRWLGPEGKLWERGNRTVNFFMRPFYKMFLAKAGLISAETRTAVEKLGKIYPSLKDRLLYLPDGVDADELSGLIPAAKNPREKENIIITAGRIGSRQKNSELLLEALKSIDLKGWRVYLLGHVEENFKKCIDEYFAENPRLRDKIFFTGNIKDRRELYSWFDRAKVFCLTSRWESFALVLAEAAYFGEYIITTRVGSAADIVKDGVSGKIIETGDINELVNAIKEAVSDETGFEKPYAINMANCRANFLWEGIAGILSGRLMPLD